MELILVDERDVEIGVSEKYAAHTNGGMLHRSFSVLLFNSKKQILLQKRSSTKYHTPLLWTNTCCSHPMPGETNNEAVRRRLMEELGCRTSCEEIFSFIYRAELGNGMVEHEFDHVFLGFCNDKYDFHINHNEISDFKWSSICDICDEMTISPEIYTPWFVIIMTNHLPLIYSWLDAYSFTN